MTELVSLWGGVLGVVGLIAAGFVVWKNSARSSAINLWRGEAEAHEARADRLEEQLKELTERVSTLERENAMLRDMVTQESAIKEIAHQLSRIESLLISKG